ncbi:acetyl-CoA carboxylase biotin carboxyl carrier protein subunit [Burkholderia stabilis]|uniref:Acetyl-CoA carboxylase biotin carboxyl carrier protein subunit,Acetyl/propionyl-CoA carboxylase, alpha subunit,pyruvate carboxylase,Biotin-requiring enzyme n=1 Tax=Burkholderia stabilis TaxID=95485 RepID=A0AAJ5NE20_9BURK|nr:acetyl-CoA carboxylase biotin carboxyl carrier protein subunit [Burkholderia stabilis]VBB13958.1 acetyl-CoA carboxylase biotin carboxyl carrier protein subunit,Acetyl/propionyl-CoA carboxylase, alpha subunit,pyruvate carboxylase,Biotin-requiring enzyme [Burkholderia stabilis]
MSIAPRRTRYAGILSGVPGDALSTRIDVQTIEADTCRATFDDGDTMLLHLKRHESLPGGGIRVVAEIGGARHEILLTRTSTSNLVVDYAGMHRDIALQGAARERGKAGSGAGRAAHTSITSPMPARITEILVGASDLVDEGAPLLRLEAMKMVITLPSPRRCRIETVHVAAEQSVEAGERLISLADADPA